MFVEQAEAKAREEARLAVEWEGMVKADKYSMNMRVWEERQRAEEAAAMAMLQAEKQRKVAEAAKEAAEGALTEKAVMAEQLEMMKQQLDQARGTTLQVWGSEWSVCGGVVHATPHNPLT